MSNSISIQAGKDREEAELEQFTALYSIKIKKDLEDQKHKSLRVTCFSLLSQLSMQTCFR